MKKRLVGLLTPAIILLGVLVMFRGGFNSQGIFSSPLSSPPQILHGPRLSLVSQSSLAITWETDVPATSVVRYGSTSSYGYSVSDTAKVLFHSLGLTGLNPSALYHYQVSSTGAGGTVSSPDYTFSTAVYETQDFDFVSLADSRAWGEYDPLPAALSYIIDRIRAYNPNLVLFGGDAIYGSADSTRMRSQWDEWKQVTDPLAHRVPMYLAIGNHEANVYSHNYDGALIFRDEFVQPANGPTGFSELAYSFDYGNAHFVCLDSDVFTDPSRINSTQRLWLQNDLRSTHKLHKFVIAHEQAFPPDNSTHSSLQDNRADRDAFWSLLQAYHVDAYICGHIHLWNRDFFVASGHGNPPVDTSVPQIINGTCGAPITTGYGGDYYHFVEWEVSGEQVKARTVDNYGVVRDSFEYRVAPLMVELTPETLRVRRGQFLTYYVDFENTVGDTQSFQYWADLYLPNGRPYQGNPVYGPVAETVAPYDSRNQAVMHRVPANAPYGTYLYVGRAGAPPNQVIAEDTLRIIVVAGGEATEERPGTRGGAALWHQGRRLEVGERK